MLLKGVQHGERDRPPYGVFDFDEGRTRLPGASSSWTSCGALVVGEVPDHPALRRRIASKVVAVELERARTLGRQVAPAFSRDRIEGLLDEARLGRPRSINNDMVAAVIERTLRATPSDATHWSFRSMAGATGFSHTTIRRIWNAFGLQPDRAETFKLSSDPMFVDKVREIVGLYLSPPNCQSASKFDP